MLVNQMDLIFEGFLKCLLFLAAYCSQIYHFHANTGPTLKFPSKIPPLCFYQKTFFVNEGLPLFSNLFVIIVFLSPDDV